MSQITDSLHDIEILNASLGGEYFGIAAYQAAIGTGLLEDGVVAVAEKFQADHQQHALRIQEAITRLGGELDQQRVHHPLALSDEVEHAECALG